MPLPRGRALRCFVAPANGLDPLLWTRLLCCGFQLGFECCGADVSECGVTSLAIVPGLDVLEDGASCVIASVPVSLEDQLQFQRGEEAFRDRVVPTVALVAHTGND